MMMMMMMWWEGRGGCDVIFNITEGGLELFFLFWRGVLPTFLLDSSSFSAPPPPPDNYCTVPYISLSIFNPKSLLDRDKSYLWACMIHNWSFESPVALVSPGLPLLSRTHLNPSTCPLTMQSCHYRKTRKKEAFLFLAQPMTWHGTGHLPLQRNKVPS